MSVASREQSKVADNDVYCAIGRAVTAWHVTEEALRDLFTRIIVCSLAGSMLRASPRSAFILGGVFYGVTNLQARLQIVENLLTATVTNPDLMSRWTTIRNKVQTVYKRRNTLAHSTVWGNQTKGLTMLAPSMFVVNARKMNLAQILAAERSFQKTGEQITEYAIAINKHLAVPESGP